jgi:RNA polymerase sigma factor for flagellar operon FliA
MVDASDVPSVSPQVSARPVEIGPGPDLDGHAAEADRPQATQEFILSYRPLVESIARRMYGSLPPNALLELHDLAQSGLVGLVTAGRSYDPTTAVPFSTYARYRIEGEILDSLRRNDHAPRNLRRWQKQVNAARQELAAALNRQPTEEELCDRLMVSTAEMRNRNLALSAAAPVSRAAAGDHPFSDLASRPDTHPDHICSQRQLREVLDRLIENLPVRRQQVIRLYYRGHMTLKEIGATLGVNESRVSQMHRSALRAMAKMLKDSGICSPADL